MKLHAFLTSARNGVEWSAIHISRCAPWKKCLFYIFCKKMEVPWLEETQESAIGKKVKVTLVQALRLCTGRRAHRGSRGIALPFHGHSTRRGWGVSVTPRPLFTPGKDPVPIVQKAGWAPGPVWTGTENLAPLGFDPRTVQPVAIRYADWATQPTICHSPTLKDCAPWTKAMVRLFRCTPWRQSWEVAV